MPEDKYFSSGIFTDSPPGPLSPNREGEPAGSPLLVVPCNGMEGGDLGVGCSDSPPYRLYIFAKENNTNDWSITQ